MTKVYDGRKDVNEKVVRTEDEERVGGRKREKEKERGGGEREVGGDAHLLLGRLIAK